MGRAEADVAQKQAELTAAQERWDHPVERTRTVASALAMVAETRAQLKQQEAEIAAETARLEELNEQVGRLEKTRASNATSEFDLISAQKKQAAQQGVTEAAKAHGPVLEAQLAQRQADLRAAEENQRLRIEESRELAVARAAAAMAKVARSEAQLRLARMEVRSPADGVVMARRVAPGSKVMLGADHPDSATVVTLYDPNHLQVRADVPLADAAKVGVGMQAQIIVGVLPDRTFSGEVSRIVPEADISKNTLQVKVAIRDPLPQLKPEMLARVRFIESGPATNTTSSVLGVFAPRTLIHQQGDQSIAWVVDRESTQAIRRTVELGPARQGDWVVVRSGLMPGDLLIADAGDLREGNKVARRRGSRFARRNRACRSLNVATSRGNIAAARTSSARWTGSIWTSIAGRFWR